MNSQEMLDAVSPLLEDIRDAAVAALGSEYQEVSDFFIIGAWWRATQTDRQGDFVYVYKIALKLNKESLLLQRYRKGPYLHSV